MKFLRATHRRTVSIFINVLLLIIVVSVWQDLFSEGRTLDTPQVAEWKKETQEIFRTHYLQRDFIDKEIRLKDLTPMKWDYVFAAGYYTDGIRVVKDHIRSGDISINLKEYAISDEYFADGEEGMVFVNTKDRTVITAPLDVPLNIEKAPIPNFRAENVCVMGKFGPHGNYYFLLKKCSGHIN